MKRAISSSIKLIFVVYCTIAHANKQIEKRKNDLSSGCVLWWWGTWTKPQVGHLQIHVLLYTRSYTKWRRRRTSILFMLLLTVVSILKLSLSLSLTTSSSYLWERKSLFFPPTRSFFFTALSLVSPFLRAVISRHSVERQTLSSQHHRVS